MVNGVRRKGGPDSRGIIFRLLRDSSSTTRTELAHRSGLSKPTVSEIVADLLQWGLLEETGKFGGSRGRSRVLLELVATARLTLGAHLGDGVCTVVLADLRARPLATARRLVSGPESERFFQAIQECVAELMPFADAPVLGLGVGVPASVDPTGRRVTISVPYGWKDLPIADLLEARLGIPVLATNRAKAAALGELWRGGHAGTSDLVYAFIGRGIVAGIIANGSLYFGNSGGAGELGHVTVLPDGPVCGCGNRGCLHTLASESAIVRSYRSRAREKATGVLAGDLGKSSLGAVTLEHLLDAARRGDDVVLETLREAGAYLGIALANVVNLINPSRIVIGGPVSGFGEPLLEPVRAEIQRRALWDNLGGLEIVSSSLGEDAGTIGAAALLLESIQFPTVM